MKSLSTPHILVVDDDPDLRDLLASYLGSNGFTVAVAGDGVAMWAALAHTPADAIVLDLMLPGEDGLALTRALRAKSLVPILMLSARGEELDRVVGLEVGADDYLAKPFSPRELLARLRALLRRSHANGDDATARSATPGFGPFTLFDLLRGYERDAFDRSIDNRVARLRRKIERDTNAPVFIRTIRSEGYLFNPRGELP